MMERIGRQDDDCDEMQQWAARDERVVLVAAVVSSVRSGIQICASTLAVRMTMTCCRWTDCKLDSREQGVFSHTNKTCEEDTLHL